MSHLRKAKETTVSMRKLIAGEMSTEVREDRESCSNVVARLMGLEALPQLHLETSTPRSRSRSSTVAGKFHKHHIEFEGIWESPQKANLSRKGKFDGSMSDKQLDLVRRKFMEAKRFVTDDKLHRSKEFQEALGFLSCNKDLFVKFLQESDSLFSQHLSDFQPVPPHPDAKRITVLRPSKGVDAQKCGVQDGRSKQIKNSASSNQEIRWTNAAEPTRIVVLKSSPGKALDIKAIVSSSPNEAGDSETRQVAEEITRQIRETFRGHCRNETLSSSSSVLSNGYISDDGSLNKLNMETLSNSEIMSSSSRHSWDCANRFERPFSSSSFSRVSFSAESSVYREAKKRLSERWAAMSLNGDTYQQKNVPKASTALGDMLALSETTRLNEESKQEARRSNSCISSRVDQVESTSDSLNTLERSESVPEIGVNSEAQGSRELTESRSLKSSWKVPSLFFFRNKKANKEKTDALSQLALPSDAPQQQSISLVEDQPSPVSVLHQPYEEEYEGNQEYSIPTKPCTTQGEEMSLKSYRIDKSPPIGSIARVFSCEDDSYIDIAKTGIGTKEDENWYDFVKTLLTTSGFRGSDPLMTRWHSPDSPLDPSLRDKFANKERRRKQQSNRKLVFDCINAIIIETTSTASSDTSFTEGFEMVEHVWTKLNNCVVLDSNILDGESLVSEEVVGKVWSYRLQVEMNNLGIGIEVLLLQDLVQEAVFDLTR